MSTTTVPGKQAKVQELLRILNEDLNGKSISDDRRSEVLGHLKVYGRDPRGAEGIYSNTGIVTLCSYAFAGHPPEVSREALRCIANALLLQPRLRTVFVDLGHTISTAGIYQQQNDDDEFLGARILFLLTYGTKADFKNLLAAHDLAQSIEKHLSRHSATGARAKEAVNPMENMAMSESLKLVFNLADHYSSEMASLSLAVPAICTTLLHTPIQPSPLEAPLSLMINALAILDLSTLSTSAANDISQEQYADLVPKLVEILDKTVKTYSPVQLDTQAIPLVTVLRKIYGIAAANIKSQMQKVLLPDDTERDLPLGQSSTLPSHLLRLTTAPGLSNLPEAISAFMFQMSDEDASKFIKNIGYGYAAGYLMTHDIPVPESVTNGTTDDKNEVPINPVTGQRLDKEVVPDLPEMTQAEKEREAERLFVLFERLKATGVVDVKNPVQKAMEEGRFEEVDSDPD